MSIRSTIRSLAKRISPGKGRQSPWQIVRARYDAVQTTPENRRHWANADYLSAGAAASPEVRREARARARYEVANNSYAKGMLLTMVNDLVGSGPRLQMLGLDRSVNEIIEREFGIWANGIRLADKLRTLHHARIQDGEGFLLAIDNPAADLAITLDYQMIEGDQVAFQYPDPNNPIDGIRFDAYGNPVSYSILKTHPGANMVLTPDAVIVPARNVIHWFRCDRPGQERGLPEILPALNLFAQLRRFTLAVLTAAETAANMALVMETNAPSGGSAAEITPMTEMEVSPNTFVFAPEGWKPTGLKAEQPTTTYETFKREILNEIARCLNMPYNIAAGNSSSYNYASGRLDHQTYRKNLSVLSSQLANTVLDRILLAWLAEARRVLRIGDVDTTHQWFFDGHEHVDPSKEATAQAQRLASNTTNLAIEYARQGRDWEQEIRQRARELGLLKELGMSAGMSTADLANEFARQHGGSNEEQPAEAADDE